MTQNGRSIKHYSPTKPLNIKISPLVVAPIHFVLQERFCQHSLAFFNLVLVIAFMEISPGLTHSISF